MLKRLFCLLLVSLGIEAHTASLPLEAVVLEGTQLSKAAVLEIAGLRLGAPVNQSGVEQGCKNLESSGSFQAISIRYGPGPKRGYMLTLTLEDRRSMLDAVFDVPAVDDNEVWQWLAMRYAPFKHRVPAADPEQQFLAWQIEQHLGANLDGQPLVAKLETEFSPRFRTMASFQPGHLPAVGVMNFSGQQELSAAELNRIMEKVVANEGYTGRRFRNYIELNIRRAYEEHGMYRVRFPSITMQKPGGSTVAVTTTIEERLKYALGEVQQGGESLPAAAMLEAGKFKKGKTANWTEIESGVWETEKPLKRTGYFEAVGRPERVFHDETHVLDVRVIYNRGPLYHFGQLTIVGLPPNLEAKARTVWRHPPGDSHDYA